MQLTSIHSSKSGLSTLKTRVPRFIIRLPASIKAEAEKLAAEDGTSLNQFVASAVAEKISALRTAGYFEVFRERANMDAFDRIMARKTGAAPAEGDEMHDWQPR